MPSEVDILAPPRAVATDLSRWVAELDDALPVKSEGSNLLPMRGCSGAAGSAFATMASSTATKIDNRHETLPRRVQSPNVEPFEAAYPKAV